MAIVAMMITMGVMVDIEDSSKERDLNLLLRESVPTAGISECAFVKSLLNPDKSRAFYR